MSSDYDVSDDENEYYDGMDMDDDDDMNTQDDAISEEEMDIEMHKGTITSEGKRKACEVEFDTMPQESVEALIRKEVDHITSIFGVSSDVASLLLRHMEWNKERLIEKYMDDPSEINVKAGVSVAPPPSPPAASSGRIPNSRSKSFASSVAKQRTTRRIPAESASRTKPASEPPVQPQPTVCQICFDDEQTEMSCLSCGHKFCNDCWGSFLRSKIREEGEMNVRCMASDCSLIAPDSFIYSTLASDEDTIKRHQELIVRHYVGCNKNLKFCPYPSCNYTVFCPAAATKAALTTIVPTVRCGASDKHTFCFGCSIDTDHRPVICPVARLWLKKCQDDSETANWIKSNTKECSKCQSTIEKNGGCNHMTCKKCKYEFCWVCMGPWSEHGTSWYNCNRYDESSGVEARDAQARSRASLERYLHYYNRWANHEQSAKLSVDLYAKTEKKMEEMQITSNLTWIEVQFAKKAVDEVFKCRMTLKWTYAMAYYLAKGNMKELFEDNQRDLERAVEDLSELLESPIEADNIPALRQKMQDKTVYVHKRNEIMLEDTAEGFLEGRWTWNVDVEGF
ncbi:uncharacterized protein FOMMEDRAFT_20123 [Fomitiporia mediterranea MF3/22]|uniref:uncharacterized protein n=1 Tax=Fomitiporia mediterranea (strain MF3/22) TaxID=694068 RepID=UPI00044084DA|nr:uncharacterized protein FOMMEDRAFT_20123 [Fomitiporia mediterranea MF3/22]EJD02922.1 hypothetical protein FOMMEDRAFT_20123 [Fomitiporia mediterranea MF3/22]